jgi:hypothetical protein
MDVFGDVYFSNVVCKVPVDRVTGADPFRPLAVCQQLLPAESYFLEQVYIGFPIGDAI